MTTMREALDKAMRREGADGAIWLSTKTGSRWPTSTR